MPFSFLNPWFLLGAATVAFPLWLHLRRRQETNILSFSTLRFLDDQPQPQRSPLRLRNLFLLALRLLALLGIVAAFAWPYLRGANTAPLKESCVYILDNTLSHQAGDGFAKDRKRLLSELASADNGIQVAVVELRSTPRVVAAFGDNRDQAIQRVQDLQPSFERGSYLAAFRMANSLLASSLGSEKRVVLRGDNQENQWNENASSPPFLRNVQVDLPKSPARSLPNLSVSDPRVQRIFLGDRTIAHFTARLTHIGEARTAVVNLRVNGQEVFNRDINLEGQPESLLLQAQWEAAPDAWLRGELTVHGTPDALEADNRAWFALAPVREGKVALLAQSSYLRLALSPEIMRGQWRVLLLDPTALANEVTANQDADVLCIESSYLQSADARALLSRYLANGRGVFLLVNRVTPVIKAFLNELGFEAEGIESPTAGSAEKFQFVFLNHPVFHPFLSPDYGNLLDIRVSKYARLKPAQAMPLVISEKGSGLFFQDTSHPGKLFVAAFGLDREHSSWPVHQTFIPFLDLTLQAARAEDPWPASFEPSETALLHVPPDSTVREMVLKDGNRELTRVSVQHGRAQLPMPDKPGLYSLFYDTQAQPEKILSVNPSPKESQLVYSDSPDALKGWVLNRSADSATSTLAMAQAPRLRFVLQQRFWWWLVLAGIATLLLETAYAEYRGRKVTH
jgi:hypothetical protein